MPKKRRPQLNYSVPEAVHEAFHEMRAPFGEKEPWMVMVAAVLMAAEVDESVLRAYVRRIAAANPGDEFAALVRKAKSGELRREVVGEEVDQKAEAGGAGERRPKIKRLLTVEPVDAPVRSRPGR